MGEPSSDSDPYNRVGSQGLGWSCLSTILASGCLGLLMGLTSSDPESYKSVGWHVGWVSETLAPAGCLGEVCLLSEDRSALSSDCTSDSEVSISVGGTLEPVSPVWDAPDPEDSLKEHKVIQSNYKAKINLWVREWHKNFYDWQKNELLTVCLTARLSIGKNVE